jgi:L-2-hydroxyglutarate oxidase LhgO
VTLNQNSLFPNGFPLHKYTDGEFNKIMDRVGITATNAANFEKLKSVSLKDPFFQKQKEVFDNDDVQGLLLNCAGTGSQIIKRPATCAIDQTT